MPIVDLVENCGQSVRIVAVGVGGAGCNAIDRLIEAQIAGLRFMALDTDGKALTNSRASHQIQIGRRLTFGWGSGGKPQLGRDAIRDGEEEVAAALQGTDLVFIVVGMGGGTGTGVAPGVARLARAQGALTVAVVTTPFRFEGSVRLRQAEEGLAELSSEVDAIVVIANESLLGSFPLPVSMRYAFRLSDEALCEAVRGLFRIIAAPNSVCLDLADVGSALRGMGQFVMGTSRAAGDGRAVAAAMSALSSPLLQAADLGSASGVLVNVEGSDVGIAEISQVVATIQEIFGDQVHVIYGHGQNETLGDELQVTLIVGGVKRPPQDPAPPPTRVPTSFLVPEWGDPAQRPTARCGAAQDLSEDSGGRAWRYVASDPAPVVAPGIEVDGLCSAAAADPPEPSSQSDLSRLMGWGKRAWRDVPSGPAPASAPGIDVGGSCSAAAADLGARPGQPLRADEDVVNCSVFSPARMRCGHSYLVQVFVHLPSGGAVAAAIAQEADPGASRRGFSSLAAAVARNSTLSFHLAMAGIEITSPYALALWGGDTTAVNFAVTVPEGHVGGDVVGRVTVVQRGMPIGLISFVVGIEAAQPERRVNRQESEAPRWIGRARRYHRAFISYASRDRAEVMKRVQVLDTLCISYFQDVLSLRAGDFWERDLYRLIDESDVLLLFWSRASQKSRHVLAEIDHALQRKGGVEDNPPDIIPIPIEGPPIPEPPQSLRHLHFDARSLYYMRDAGSP